jgi:electron transfer flavoprotein alpha subunit
VSRVAVVPVRGGEMVSGGAECVAECDGRAVLVGEGTNAAAAALAGIASAPVRTLEAPTFAAGAWAAMLAAVVAGHHIVVLPASADGRDVAPRLAAILERPLLAGAVAVGDHGADLARYGGQIIETVGAAGPFVATLQPGVRGLVPAADGVPAVEPLDVAPPAAALDAEVIEVLPPDVATMDLAEATAIVAGGAGLDSPERFVVLERVGVALDASIGATRVITDRGWLHHDRQIGTTGVVVGPRIYVAFGISGAVQHTSGLGQPDHIASVNTDPYCPMMQLADVAIVADANAVLDELAALLGVDADA